jgi:GNAT superfamily N-acetyltransferase
VAEKVMDWHIREATPDDAEDVSLLIHSLLPAFINKPAGIAAQHFLTHVTSRQLSNNFVDKQFYTVVATIESDLVGYASLRGGNHLYHVFVSPAYQGLGLSRQMWLALQKNSPQTTQFKVNASLNAMAVYEHFGFCIEGKQVDLDGFSYQPMVLNKAIEM